MPSRLCRILLAAPLAASLPLAAPGRAQPASPGVSQAAPVTIDTLATTLGSMGYDVKPGTSGKTLSIVAHGNYDLTVTFSQGSAGGEVLAYIFLQKYNPDEFAKLDKTALLLSNDSNYSYFSISRDGNDTLLYVQRSLPPAAVSPQNLRSSLDNLVKVTQATEPVWNSRSWK